MKEFKSLNGYTVKDETARNIAKGKNQAVAFGNYSTMITALKALSKDEYKVGQNIYIGTVGVPDLWVYSVESTLNNYEYTTDEAFVNLLDANTTVQVGYYKLSMLEGQKVDLTEYEKTKDADEKISAIQKTVDELNSEIESTKKELDTDLNTLNANLTNHTHSNATTSKSGFMTADMVKKHNAINDYVTKITKGTNYTYREWASGIKELWLKTIISTSVSVPWGSWYIVGPLSVNFPITFSSARHVQLCVSASNDIAVPIFYGYSTSWAKFYLARGNVLSSAQSFEIEVYVIGT